MEIVGVFPVKPLIVTASEGEEFAEIRKITWPRLAKYADNHGMEFLSCDLTPHINRPPAWKKLIAIASGLSRSGTVIWVDADVYVLNFIDDIMAGVPDGCWQAMARHTTNEGDVPNTGVWVLRREMLPILVAAAMLDGFVSHPWWEQGAIHAMMGFELGGGGNRHVHDTLLYQKTHWLNESFNVCRYTPRAVKQNWLHACGITTNRLEAIREWDRAANS